VGFAAWTLVYHVCLVLDLGAGWAAAAAAPALIASAWWTLRRAGEARPPVEARARTSGGDPRPLALLAVNALAAVLAAVLFAREAGAWVVVLLLWIVACGSAVVLAAVAGSDESAVEAERPWPELVVVATWAIGLAVLALLLVGPDSDDGYYLHLASWIGAHGQFPLRDVLYSDERFPALFYPPVNSYEALTGTVSHITSIEAPGLVYLGVPPLAAFLSVLALWRLLRCWRAPMPAVALSVALVFLLFDAQSLRTLGAFFVGRLWQGKVVFLCVLVPLMFALLHEYAERPSRRRAALLAAAGVAGVGLTTNAIFVVPVIAAGCLAPVAARRPARAGAGLLAAAGYPLAAGVLTLAVGGRTPDAYTAADVVPSRLAHYVLGTGVMAAVAMLASVAGPVLIRRHLPAQMVAATALLVGCLLAPGVPELILDLTGLGGPLWRLLWAIPTAALVGLVATGLVTGRRPAPARAAPAAVVVCVVVLAGQTLWSAPRGWPVAAEIATHPAWKLSPDALVPARLILAAAHEGDLVLAPSPLSWTLTAISGGVSSVSARPFYTRALSGVPAAHVPERELLQHFISDGLDAVRGRSRRDRTRRVRRALRTLGVDIACVSGGDPLSRSVLAGAGYVRPIVTSSQVTCRRAAPT
jgi:hypothetical protein